MHDDSTIDPYTNKPEIILDYNMTKGGVDTVDKMCNTYSVGRRTKRWPLAFFFQLLNIAGINSINSQILYNGTHPESPHKSRRIFLKTLALSLMKPFLSERAAIPTLPIDIRHFLSRYRQTKWMKKRSHPEKLEEDAPSAPEKKIELPQLHAAFVTS
ncbi:unnamed protein product [Acanthoscelides obtectus]|uniref:PiggyBac transposable element-derived protein domain-containing protein n=1 Tax=Acanthoscelides obtectus TaxID=200917 RepID=A0A9P0PLN0_ACAOB|nr:unnamed protein product [Acanthoscelides obtectus]CAK1632740.1 hypothetical protein AOBTE_LOCUS7709 [Acanthoscelides obtectus]